MGRFTIPTLPTLPPGVKPSYPVEIDKNNPYSDVAACLTFQNGEIVDLVSGKVLTKVGAPVANQGGVEFDGTSDGALLPLDLSDTDVVTIAAGIDIPSYANDDGMFMEYTTNSNTFAGLLVSPGASSGHFALVVTTADPYYILARFTRPSTGYHDYIFRMKRTQSGLKMLVDGVEQTATYTLNHSQLNGTFFAQSNFYIGSRALTSYFANTKNNYLYIWKRDIWWDEALALSKNPHQFLKPAAPQTQIITPATTPNDRVWIV